MNFKKILLPLLLCLGVMKGQDEADAQKFSKYISADHLKKNLSVLASDEYEGRETGMKGQKMAAKYIADHFRSSGIPPFKTEYFQKFNVVQHKPQQINISINGKIFKAYRDYFSPSAFLKDSMFTISEITFAGYGINTTAYNDYEKGSLKSKVVLISEEEPVNSNGISLISNTKELSDWSTNRRKKITQARKNGFKILFIAENDIEKSKEENAHRIYYSKMTLEDDFKEENLSSDLLIIHISNEMANAMLSSSSKTIQLLKNSIKKNGKPETFETKTSINIKMNQTHEIMETENVIGFVEGTDLKDELIVITAHYDHIGKEGEKIFNGADDDGSGTVAVMELANAFMQSKLQGKGPRRSILFMTVAGEEKGLLGSDYYSRHPLHPLGKTVANLNIDMIGRLDKAHEGNPNYVYIIGSNMLSTELHQLNEVCNKKFVQLELDYTYNREDDPNRYYYRSDHYNFAKNDVPVIFYFNGVHDDYHQETDEVEKINFQKIEKISRLVFHTAWELANRNERIKLDPGKSTKKN